MAQGDAMSHVAVQQEKSMLSDYQCSVIINSGSGTLNAQETVQALKSSQPHLQIEHFNIIEGDVNPEKAMKEWFDNAAKAGHAVIVAGGDGTLSLGIKFAIECDVPIAVLGMGTFNLFARHYNLPVDPLIQIQSLNKYALTHVSMCFANNTPFTTSAAFGLYPEIIEEREYYQEQFGFRSQATGYFAGLLTFLKNRPSMRFKFTDQGEVFNHESLVFMATHNRIHLENLGFDISNAQLEEEFALVSINPETLSEKLRLVMKGSVGTLNEDPNVHLAMRKEIILDADQEFLDCAVDGEILRFNTPVKIERRTNALRLFLPNT